MSHWRSDAGCLVSLCCLALGACGGGGGSSSPPPPPPTYSVSGTVSGLKSPVVLAVSGMADVTVIANGSLTFMTGVANGTAYAVSVHTQPTSPHQDCTVMNGAGTVSANVSNIAIQCVDIPFALSSSVPANAAPAAARTGDLVLTFSLPLDANVPASAVTLQSAQGTVPTTFTVSGNQLTVTPAQRLAGVMTHTLTVGTALHGTGGEQMMTPVVLTFMTADGTWGQPQPIRTLLSAPSAPELAMNASGEAIAIWQDSSLSVQLHQTVTMNRFLPGVGWLAAPQNIAYSAGGGTIADLDIALADNGDALAAWKQDDDGAGSGVANIRANRRFAGEEWDSNNVATVGGSSNFALSPRIALNASGQAMVVWEQYNADSMVDILARRTSGITWGFTSLIESNTGNAFSPQVAMDANGDALVVWHQDGGSQNNVWRKRFVADSGWDAAQLLESDNAGGATFPKIAMNANGDAIALWTRSDGTRDSLWARPYTKSGGWSSDLALLETGAFDVYGAQIAVDPQGNAIAVWSQSNGTRLSIWTNRYVVGNGWGSAELLEADESGDAGAVRIAIDPRGNAMAIWQQSDGSHINIRARRYVAGTGWTTSSLVENSDAGDAAVPKIGLDASGNAIAVWRQSNNIWANRFE